MWTRATTAALPARDRFDWYHDVVVRTLLPTQLRSERHTDDFHAEAAALALGAAQVSTFAHSPLRSRRNPALIRRSDPEQYQLALMTKGRYWMSQRGSDTEIGPGDLILWDTSHPHEAASLTSGIGVVILQLPRQAMPLPTGRIDRLLGRRIATDAGMGAVLAGFIRSLASHGTECTPHELARFGTVAVDMAAACLAGQADPYGQPPAEFRAQVLRRQIDAFIEHNLGDPALTPSAIAAHHHISVRTLHQLFRERPQSVAASIRRRRLEACRTDLGRPDLARLPIQAIAARWGYTGASAFSRAFREAFGISPREFRHAASAAGRPSGGPARSVNEAGAVCTRADTARP
ncbi:AraC-like ligand-binding domain-containing protein [Streptomyces sp. NPDC001135]